jgi:hypothetical protein
VYFIIPILDGLLTSTICMIIGRIDADKYPPKDAPLPSVLSIDISELPPPQLN